MTDYKLVPVEPTPEMVEAAEDAYMPFGDMEMALRMAILAAPAVEAEQAVVPTGFRVMKPTGSAVREGERWEIYAPCGSGGIVHEDEVTDWVVRKLLDALATAPQPTEQQPAPDVSQLVEALEGIMRVEARDRVMPVGAEWDAARAALAAYREGGDV